MILPSPLAFTLMTANIISLPPLLLLIPHTYTNWRKKRGIVNNIPMWQRTWRSHKGRWRNARFTYAFNLRDGNEEVFNLFFLFSIVASSCTGNHQQSLSVGKSTHSVCGWLCHTCERLRITHERIGAYFVTVVDRREYALGNSKAFRNETHTLFKSLGMPKKGQTSHIFLFSAHSHTWAYIPLQYFLSLYFFSSQTVCEVLSHLSEVLTKHACTYAHSKITMNMYVP